MDGNVLSINEYVNDILVKDITIASIQLYEEIDEMPKALKNRGKQDNGRRQIPKKKKKSVLKKFFIKTQKFQNMLAWIFTIWSI